MYSIIGAGIGGLTTGLALQKAGVEVGVFERAPEIRTVGAGIWLAPNALQVLGWLGLLPAVKEAGWPIERILLARQDLRPITQTDLAPFANEFGNTTIAIHRADLLQVLIGAFENQQLHLGKTFREFIERENDLSVAFTDGSEVSTKFLIGADGIRSSVRQQLFPESSIRYSGQTCWRGVADVTLPADLVSSGTEMWGENSRFGFSTISSGKVYWFAVVTAPAGGKDNREGVKEKLLGQFKGYAPVVSNLIESTPSIAIVRGDINDLKPLANWHRGNVCLIGDAAHATTPNLGQGGAQAIVDAYYLGKLVANQPEVNVFPEFQRLRQKAVNGIVNQSWMVGKIGHLKYGRGVRNFLMGVMPESVAVRQLRELYTIGAGLPK